MNFSLNAESYSAISTRTIYDTIFDFNKARVSLIKVYGFRRKKIEGKLRWA